MTGRPEQNRRSIRLRGYDYAQSAHYFVTICTHDRQNLLGEIFEGRLHPSQLGLIAQECYVQIPRHFPRVMLDTYVVMPNHIHGIVIIAQPNKGAAKRGAACCAPTDSISPGSLGAIVRSFKAATTRRANLLRGCPRKRLWQRNYYEHIVRHGKALEKLREYICANPENWTRDPENPSVAKSFSDEIEDFLGDDFS